MKTSLFILAAIIFAKSCNESNNLDEHAFIYTIKELDQPAEIKIPLQCAGWCIRGGKVIENTANDTIRIWKKNYAPGQTGEFLSMECFDCYTKTPWVTSYSPYKATKGKIVIKWYLYPD